jgi:GT2 family glycosyltransferase
LPNPTLVSIVIPNWNGKHWLQKCLPTIAEQTFGDYEVIVVDNGSTDGSVEWVAAEFPCHKIISNAGNVGFGRSTNQGIALSANPYIVALNNDTQLAPDWLAHIMRVAQQDPQVGMWASKMVFADRPEVINSAGICLDKCAIAWDRRGGERDQPAEQGPQDVFGPCGGAALYTRKLLDDVGLFDEDFFAYLDDVDLAWRARLAGWRCLYVPDALVYHHHSSTLKRSPSRKWRLLGRNKIAMILKDYPAPQLYQYAGLILAYDLVMASFGLFARGDASHLRGRLEGWAEWRLWWGKRKPIQQHRTITTADWDKLVAPISSPWAVRKRYLHLTSVSATDP